MHLADIQVEAFSLAMAKGLHENLSALAPREATIIRLALIMTEVAEATQIVKRLGITESMLTDFGEELADVILRCADLAEMHGISLEQAVMRKLGFNRQRPHLFGTNRALGAECPREDGIFY